MDQTNIVILKASVLKRPQVQVEASNGKRYVADLSSFSSVKCFPKSQTDWQKINITAYGFNLIWASGFEVHVDQIIDHAVSEQNIKLQA